LTCNGASNQQEEETTMNDKSYTYKLFSRDDFSAFWALFTDNLINLIVLAGVCQFVFNMPAEIVFGRILPGAVLQFILGLQNALRRKKAAMSLRCPTVFQHP
jgi:hypothetical protein